MNIQTDEVFKIKESSLSTYLMRTSEDLKKNLWEKIFCFQLETSCLEGEDLDINKPLTELKNPHLVFSLLIHCLGRSIICSETVHHKFKQILKKKLLSSCDKITPKDSDYIKKIQR